MLTTSGVVLSVDLKEETFLIGVTSTRRTEVGIGPGIAAIVANQDVLDSIIGRPTNS